MTFLEIAKPLAAMGIPITPVRPGTKRAFLPDFPTTATTDEAQLVEWNKLYSDHNAACVARPVVGEVWFWESDSSAVHDRVLNDTGHDIYTDPDLNTFKVRSRQGRGHFYFRHDADSIALGNISQSYVIGQDWSVRTNREYVVAPGSIHPDTGKPYEALNWGTEIKTAPKWLIDWLLSQKIQKNAAPAASGTNMSSDAPRNENNKVPHGAIHGYMLTQAGKLRAMGLDADGIEGPLLALVHANCEPPIDESKVRQMAKSICNFEAGTPTVSLTLNQTPNPGSPAAEQAAAQKAAQEAAAAAQAALTLPRSCLASSYLAQLYDEIFAPNGWTLELALPALVTAASVLIPRPEGEGIQLLDMMTTLYTALIAPVHGGKSQVEEWSVKSLGIYSPTRNRNYTRVKFGSAEQMWKYLHSHSAMEKPQDPKAFSGAVLINPDEWSHVMAKAGIPDASFASTLTSAFYSRSHIVTLGGTGGGRDVSIPFAFSIIGGIVKDDFDSVFSSSTIGGLYDRFLFGLAPEDFHWSYKPFPADHPFLKIKPKPVAPRAHRSLQEAIQRWNDKDRDLGRIVEVCVRVATIFAGIDGRKEVTGDDLDNLWGLALYQKAIRGLYKPNAGTNPDAIFSNVALNWVNQHAKEWRTVRDLQKGTNYHRRKLGPNVAYRALQGLAASDEVELWVSKLVEDKDGKMVLNNLPPGYTGKRPRLGGALVKVASPE